MARLCLSLIIVDLGESQRKLIEIFYNDSHFQVNILICRFESIKALDWLLVHGHSAIHLIGGESDV